MSDDTGCRCQRQSRKRLAASACKRRISAWWSSRLEWTPTRQSPTTSLAARARPAGVARSGTSWSDSRQTRKPRPRRRLGSTGWAVSTRDATADVTDAVSSGALST